MQQPCHTIRKKRGRDAQIQNTTNDPLFLPPIDIVIPSPDILHTYSDSKFFYSHIPSGNLGWIEIRAIFPSPKLSPEILVGNFFIGNYVPEIFVSQNSLEIPAESRGGE